MNWWTDERIAELRRLWVDLGWSAGTIGRRWRVSRNAVIGKVHRLGWSRSHKAPLERLRPGEGDQHQAAVQRTARGRARERSLEATAAALGITVDALKTRRQAKRQRVAVAVPKIELSGRAADRRLKPLPAPPKPPPVRPAGPVDLVHLTDDDCRWPLGPMLAPTAGPATLFCGEPKRAGPGSYCAVHAERAYQARRAA